MRFAIYLMRRGVINTDQFARAVEAQHDEQAPLGQLAIEEGMLTVREVFKVLRTQSDLPHDRFGDTAVEMGLLSQRQVIDLLMLQGARRRPMSELLVDLEILTPAQVNREMQAFRRGQERGGAAARRVMVENAMQHVAERACEPAATL
ncbi:hypothetical protein Pla175_42860 [Pirellulimonas nuda]|uniref:Bacteriophage N4 adsorption protein B n=1 Tax=Pirellulimonas nuda TaxID=2528009 RepID=A0A518DHB9_9BACT|nr:hypothetical protein [Pirellulimonas nuda]QDU90873.1 hypothetical protein Pla175_42860 [Pirellulimonas nuda]